MKTEATLLNGQRFVTDEHTRLHLHTGDVSPEIPNLVVPEVGPKVHLRMDYGTYPKVDNPTPYGAGRTERTAFGFSWDLANARNYASTASSDNPIIPEELDGLTEQFRLSLFFRPDTDETSGDKALIAGMPGQFGLYQQDDKLLLRMQPDGGPLPPMYEDSLDYDLEPGAWHLLEVQWGHDVNGGVPMWYVNGAPYTSTGGAQTTALADVGDRFNVATADKAVFWSGAVRELELSDEAVWVDDKDGTDERMNARAMQLFGLADATGPIPEFERDSIGWIRTGGNIHKVSLHHPRACELGTVVEEQRTNLVGYSAPIMGDVCSGRPTSASRLGCSVNRSWML